MRNIRRYAMRFTFVALVVTAGVFGLSLWNKADFCSGWAAHYEQRAAVLRTEQSLAIAKNRPDDAKAIEESALAMAVIAEKYARVADNPLLAYPSKPLVTDAEIGAERDAVGN